MLKNIMTIIEIIEKDSIITVEIIIKSKEVKIDITMIEEEGEEEEIMTLTEEAIGVEVMEISEERETTISEGLIIMRAEQILITVIIKMNLIVIEISQGKSSKKIIKKRKSTSNKAILIIETTFMFEKIFLY